jgi:hypothetical protein
MVAPAFGDVQVAGVFEGRDDGGADGGQVGGLLPLGETAAHERRRLPLTPGSRRPACCGVRSQPDPLALARARCAEQATDWMERKRACGGAGSTSSTST